MAVGAAPELEIAVNAPVVAVLLLLLIILLFIFIVENPMELLMAVKAPVPALVPEIMLFPDMVSMPVPPVIVVIPVKMEAPVPPTVHPVIVFPVMVTLFPAALVMPVKELIDDAVPLTRFNMILFVMDIDSVAPVLSAVIGAAPPVPVVILLIVF